MTPFHRAEEAREISEINVVPLADVSLVLLIILLVLSPMMTHNKLMVRAAGRDAAAPPRADGLFPIARPPELVLAVALGPAGFTVGERAFSGPGEFTAYLSGELARREDKKVFLAPHPDAAHGLVVNALELIKSCGAESVALVQAREEGGDGEIRAPAPDAAER